MYTCVGLCTQLIEQAVGMLEAVEEEGGVTRLLTFQEAVYELLLACIKDDLNNSLFMAAHLDFFQARLSARVMLPQVYSGHQGYGALIARCSKMLPKSAFIINYSHFGNDDLFSVLCTMLEMFCDETTN